MTDAELVARLKAGEIAAFNELVVTYKQKIINTCYRFLFSVEAAEDISQEVFIEIFRSIKSFRGEASLSTWIYRITVTKCLDEIKKRKRRKRISSLGKIFHIDSLVNDIGGGFSADQSLLEKENLKLLATALDQLPESQHVAVTLSKIQGYDNKTIAAIMNIPVHKVEMLVHRGKKKLQAELEKILKKLSA